MPAAKMIAIVGLAFVGTVSGLPAADPNDAVPTPSWTIISPTGHPPPFTGNAPVITWRPATTSTILKPKPFGVYPATDTSLPAPDKSCNVDRCVPKRDTTYVTEPETEPWTTATETLSIFTTTASMPVPYGVSTATEMSELGWSNAGYPLPTTWSRWSSYLETATITSDTIPWSNMATSLPSGVMYSDMEFSTTVLKSYTNPNGIVYTVTVYPAMGQPTGIKSAMTTVTALPTTEATSSVKTVGPSPIITLPTFKEVADVALLARTTETPVIELPTHEEVAGVALLARTTETPSAELPTHDEVAGVALLARMTETPVIELPTRKEVADVALLARTTDTPFVTPPRSMEFADVALLARTTEKPDQNKAMASISSSIQLSSTTTMTIALPTATCNSTLHGDCIAEAGASYVIPMLWMLSAAALLVTTAILF